MADKIKGAGDLEYNRTLATSEEEMIVGRRTAEKGKPDNRVPCPFCKRLFVKKGLYRHRLVCSTTTDNIGNLVVMSKRIITATHSIANNIMKNSILPVLKDDEISKIIKRDTLIILFGNKLTRKYGESHLGYHIRQQLRQVAKFFLCCKRLDSSIRNFADIYDPLKFDLVLNGAQAAAGFSEKDNKFRAPTLAANLGTLIKKCGYILLTHYIKTQNVEGRKKVKDFLHILCDEYSSSISRSAIEYRNTVQRNKRMSLPSNEDIHLLYEYLRNRREKYYKLLKRSFNKKAWTELAKVLLISIQIFNRRRAGETERLLISDYRKAEKISENSPVYNTLEKTEQLLANNFVRVVIRGKLGRSVPLLITKDIAKIIDLLLDYRNAAGVPIANPYVFGYDTKMKYLRACALLRTISENCGASNPKLLRGTQLRKHIATVVQTLNLKNCDITQLANFMGHDEKIHKQHYRLPTTAIQTGQLSKIFLAMEKGEMEKHGGKSLKEIQITG